MPARKPPTPPDPDAVKRERAGRYVTADGRLAIEGESTGSWYVIDSGRLNDFGLPVMEGPFATLDAARSRVSDLRSGAGPARAEHAAEGPAAAAPSTPPAPPGAPAAHADVAQTPMERGRRRAGPRDTESERPASRMATKRTPEPAWLGRLGAQEQASARRLLALLERLGIDDASLVRRDVEGNVPEVAATLLARRVRREALDIWRSPEGIRDALAGLVPKAQGHLRPATRDAVDAAQRGLEPSRTESDAVAFAWAVAARTAIAIFEAIEREGDESRVTGEPGWRLVELDGRREPTRRTLALDATDILEPGSD